MKIELVTGVSPEKEKTTDEHKQEGRKTVLHMITLSQANHENQTCANERPAF